MSLYSGLNKEKEKKSLVGRRLLCSKYGRHRGAPTLHVSFTKEILFFSLQNGTL